MRCINCQGRPVYTRSKAAMEMELCQVCWLQHKIQEDKVALETLRLQKESRSVAAQLSKLRKEA